MDSGDWNIQYRDHSGIVTWRLITVLRQLHGPSGQAQIRAWCHLCHQERTFYVVNILAVSSAGQVPRIELDALARLPAPAPRPKPKPAPK